MKKNKKTKKQVKKNLDTKKLYYALMIVSYLYLGFACMYKYIKYEALDKCALELILILVLSLIIEYVHIIRSEQNGSKNRKKSLIKLPKKERLKRYGSECCLLSLTVTATLFLAIAADRIYVNFYSYLFGNIAITIIGIALLIFLLFFAISFIGHYAISEAFLKKTERA